MNEIVYCGECIHQDKGFNCSESWNYCKILARDIYDDFFCGYGSLKNKHSNMENLHDDCALCPEFVGCPTRTYGFED